MFDRKFEEPLLQYNLDDIQHYKDQTCRNDEGRHKLSITKGEPYAEVTIEKE